MLSRIVALRRQVDIVDQQIDPTDKQVDHPVYDLYGLTDEGIRIVEGGMA